MDESIGNVMKKKERITFIILILLIIGIISFVSYQLYISSPTNMQKNLTNSNILDIKIEMSYKLTDDSSEEDVTIHSDPNNYHVAVVQPNGWYLLAIHDNYLVQLKYKDNDWLKKYYKFQTDSSFNDNDVTNIYNRTYDMLKNNNVTLKDNHLQIEPTSEEMTQLMGLLNIIAENNSKNMDYNNWSCQAYINNNYIENFDCTHNDTAQIHIKYSSINQDSDELYKYFNAKV